MNIRHWILVFCALFAGLVSAAEPEKVADDYIIGPGDSLQVFVFGHTDLSTAVRVLPDGKISTPMVESVVAVGKSTSQLARDVETALAKFVISPQVSISVTDAVSAFSKVQVIGEVRQPRDVPYREGLRVLDAVLLAGGLTDFAAPNKTLIAREVDGKKIEIKVRLGDLMSKADTKQNVLLKPGDMVIIRRTLF